MSAGGSASQTVDIRAFRLEMTMGMGFPKGMGKALWESHGNGNWLQNWEWEWEGMEIDCTRMGGSGNVKSHSRPSLVQTRRSIRLERFCSCTTHTLCLLIDASSKISTVVLTRVKSL